MHCYLVGEMQTQSQIYENVIQECDWTVLQLSFFIYKMGINDNAYFIYLRIERIRLYDYGIYLIQIT